MTPAIEPFYASMALYDARLKKKVSNYSLLYHTPGQLVSFIDVQQMYTDIVKYHELVT